MSSMPAGSLPVITGSCLSRIFAWGWLGTSHVAKELVQPCAVIDAWVVRFPELTPTVGIDADERILVPGTEVDRYWYTRQVLARALHVMPYTGHPCHACDRDCKGLAAG